MFASSFALPAPLSFYNALPVLITDCKKKKKIPEFPEYVKIAAVICH